MNPEEGDLRPQLLDRFALAVEVEGLERPTDRAEVVRRRIAFEADPRGFAARWAEPRRPRSGRASWRPATCCRASCWTTGCSDLITQLCCDFEVDGLRADIVMYKTAAHAGRLRRAARG